jgi:hypothetical protein
MSFLISATDTCGCVTLRRETANAAVKKAAELAEDGYRDVAIIGPDGQLYSPPALTSFQRMAELHDPIERTAGSKDIPL